MSLASSTQLPADEASQSSPTVSEPKIDNSKPRTTSPLAPSSAPKHDPRISLPPHLATYGLEGFFPLYSDQEALFTRANSRLETVDLLTSVFPQLRDRPATAIKFEVVSPHGTWTAVSDAVWSDIMVDLKPTRIRVTIVPGSAESIMRWTARILIFTSPFWGTTLFVMCIAVGSQATFTLAMQWLVSILLVISPVVGTLWLVGVL